MKAYITEYSNPFANAALEEAFYKSAIDEPVLLFYVNEPTVVLGRSQNPWMEADVPWCEKNGIHILRRFSGGGAVVHDAGNLNYSFFVPRKDYQQGKYAGIVAEAIGLLGVEDVHVSGQYSIYAGEYKISGSAFAVNGHLAMAHGCILVNSDLARLSRALQMCRNCVFETSTVQSVRAPVMNISEYVPGILPGDVCSAIMAQAEVDDYPQP
ncbi:MAG: lipoate--protein ligase family protein, partial [Victivallales bacterium]|nr:lipoate--protein ligase family protein [Victivallales bacterium]